jgi:hypothetical protein
VLLLSLGKDEAYSYANNGQSTHAQKRQYYFAVVTHASLPDEKTAAAGV